MVLVGFSDIHISVRFGQVSSSDICHRHLGLKALHADRPGHRSNRPNVFFPTQTIWRFELL